MLGWPGHRVRIVVAALVTLAAAAGLAQQRGRVWARYESEMQDPVEDPPGAARSAELKIGRLRYRSPLDGRRLGGYARWGIDANKGDRLFINILRRLTRIDVAPVEQIIDVDSDEMFDYPFLFAVSVGDWKLSSSQARRLGEYLRRGGFLLVDDFHNEGEWAAFMAGVRQMGLGSEADDLDESEPAFRVVFELGDRVRVPGANVVHGSGVERGGEVPRWRSIKDDRRRMMIAISFNQDMGDGWEFADDPGYPERLASYAAKLGTNYVVYALTH